MTTTSFTGQGVFIPNPPGIAISPSLASALTITSANTNDKIAMTGHVNFPAMTGSKTLTKIHFLFGTIVKTNGSNVRVSLQNVDTTTGPVIRPDGTADQSYTILNADSSFASNTWYTATLGSSRTVSFGELLAVVWEWNSPVSGDSIIISGYSLSSAASNASQLSHQGTSSTYTSSAWAIQNVTPNIILEFDDGTFGTFDGAFPLSAIGTTTFNSSSVADEYCLEFQLPFSGTVNGAWMLINCSSGADFDIILYDSDGTTALTTSSIDANAIQINSAARFMRVSFSNVSLLANTTYRLAVKPTTTSNITIYYHDVNTENHFSVFPLGTTAQTNSRVDAGSWGTATETRRILAGIKLSGINVNASSGGYNHLWA